MGNVFISPLNWGLGHATRTIPIIKELLKWDHEITIATSDSAMDLLKKEFPYCTFINLKGYPIPLASDKHYTMKLILSFPKLLSAIKEEKKNIDLLLAKKKYDLIISDNRFGVYSKKIPSFFMTHQVRFNTPIFLRFASIFTQLFNSHYHKNFERIIIPDNNPELGCLSGKLCQSNIPLTKKKSYFAGILCSIKKLKIKEDIDFLISITGPEPQRTRLEEILLKQVTSLPGKKIVLQGKPGDNFKNKLDNNTTIKSYADRKEMAKCN